MSNKEVINASAYELVEDSSLKTIYELKINPQDLNKIKQNGLENSLNIEIFGMQDSPDIQKVKNNLKGSFDLERDIYRDERNRQIDQEIQKYNESEIDETLLNQYMEEMSQKISQKDFETNNLRKNIDNANYILCPQGPRNEAINIFNFNKDERGRQGYMEDWEVKLLNNDLKEIYQRNDAKFR